MLRTTWGWVNDGKILIFGWTIPLRLEWQQHMFSVCRPEVWVPGCLPASEWEEDLQRTEHRASTGTCQPASQASDHYCWRCGWRSTQHSGPQQVCLLKTHNNKTFARNAHNGWLWNRTSDSRNVDSEYGISKQLSEYLAFLSILFIFLMTLANITVHCNRDIKVTTVVTLMEIFFCKVLAFWGLRISCYLKMLG